MFDLEHQITVTRQILQLENPQELIKDLLSQWENSEKQLIKKHLTADEIEKIRYWLAYSPVAQREQLSISFGKTLKYLLKHKTVTRRIWKPNHAKKFVQAFKSGQQILATDKRLDQGGKVIGHLTLTCEPYQETLSDMPESDLIEEGGMVGSLGAFIKNYFEGNSEQVVWVIRFNFIPLEKPKPVLDLMKLKIISGGQTGVDMGALIAATTWGFETGGYAPLGWLTENGKNLKLEFYGLIEDKTASQKDAYASRTVKNIEISDGTIVLGDASSAGSRLTIAKTKELNKKLLTIPLDAVMNKQQDSASMIFNFIVSNQIQTLNIAGNRESKAPGIQKATTNIIEKVLKMILAQGMTDDGKVNSTKITIKSVEELFAGC
jgi:Circularly permutated YpsA SLOG family